MSEFEIPQGAPLPPKPVPPPVDPMVAREQQITDATRAEEALNGFIAAQQHALFEAPDAFYRTEGSDAIHAAPAILDTLSKLRDDHLDGLANDAQRNRLAAALDAHMDLARDDVARHVAEQSLAWQRKVAQDRIALLAKQAAYHHNDDTMVDALGEAAATAARAHARVGDIPPEQEAEDAAAATARSGVLGAAIQARFDRGDAAGAAEQFNRLKDQLDPTHAQSLRDVFDAAQGDDDGIVRHAIYRPDPNAQPADATMLLPYKPLPGDSEQFLVKLGDASPGVVPVSDRSAEMTAQVDTPPDNVEVAQAVPGAKQARPPVRKRDMPPEQIAYPTEEQQKEIDSHLHPKEISDEAARRKAVWDEMLKQLPQKGPRIKVPLPDDWRAELNKIDPSYARLTEEAAKKFDIPPELLARLFHTESSHDKRADNGVRKGIPQMGADELRAVGVDPKTFLDASGETQINAAAAYLAKQYGAFRNWPQAVAAYHSGRKSIEDWSAGAGPSYDSEQEIGKPYVGYGGDLRALTTPREIARGRSIMKQWDELRGELPYVFLGNAQRYDGTKTRYFTTIGSITVRVLPFGNVTRMLHHDQLDVMRYYFGHDDVPDGALSVPASRGILLP